MRLFVISLFFVITSAVIAVNKNVPSTCKLPTQCEVLLPKVLCSNLITEKETNALMETILADGNYTKGNTYWNAWSDRNNNITYDQPGGQPWGKLAWNQKVRIARISKGYALVYNESVSGLNFPNISASAQAEGSLGWVPLKHLLLWQSCPTNDLHIYHKALIVMNLNERKKGENEIKALAYQNPETRSEGKQLRSMAKFFYVMKEEGDLCLLATGPSMSGLADNVLFGWVSRKFFIPWDQRSCLEPNWNKSDADFFAGKGDSARVFLSPSLDTRILSKPYAIPNKVDNQNFPYRLNPGLMRFPILDNNTSNQNIYHCTAFAGWGKGNLSDDVELVDVEDNDADIIIDQALKNQAIINLIIVIDGTTSMGDFYDPMQKAIQEASNYLGDEGRRTVKVGVVIYRDYSDGEYVTEVQPMTDPKSPALRKFLTDGGNYGIKSSPNDRTMTEALFKGIDVALDTKTMGYSPENSNIMLVVGDCGNALNDKKIESSELARRLVENNIQLASFQVRNKNDQDFYLFRDQMGELIRDNLGKQYARVSTGIKTKWSEVPNGVEFIANVNRHFFLGSSHWANEEDGVMRSADLEQLITHRYQQFSLVINEWLKILQNADITLGGGQAEDPLDVSFLATKFTPDELKRVKAGSSLMAVDGYTLKCDESGRSYWQPVLYITSDEFKDLLKNLGKVVNSSATGSDRKAFVNAIKHIIKAQVPDYSDSELNSMSTDKVMELIGGLHAGIKTMNKYTLSQIQDENAVPPSTFNALVASFKRKYKNLERMLTSYPYKVRRNETTYYWIPVEDLP